MNGYNFYFELRRKYVFFCFHRNQCSMNRDKHRYRYAEAPLIIALLAG